MTFQELDKKALYFPEGVDTRPYQRVVVLHAAHAISEMWKKRRLRSDIEHFPLEVRSVFEQKPTVQAWVETTMACVKDWPVGPGAEDEV